MLAWKEAAGGPTNLQLISYPALEFGCGTKFPFPLGSKAVQPLKQKQKLDTNTLSFTCPSALNFFFVQVLRGVLGVGFVCVGELIEPEAFRNDYNRLAELMH